MQDNMLKKLRTDRSKEEYARDEKQPSLMWLTPKRIRSPDDDQIS